MMNPSNPQSQKRAFESLSSLFEPLEGEKSFLFLKSSSDEGVVRNGGRNGARFAPRSLLACFKQMTRGPLTESLSFAEVEVSSIEEEKSDFSRAQEEEAKRIETALGGTSPGTRICHIGGGHDHIYPFLRALSKKYKKIIVLNIDAHADTRTDDQTSSGTPFRQFSECYEGEYHLFLIGLHRFANSQSTLTPLTKGTSHILWKEELHDPEKMEAFFEKISTCASEDSLVVFSLDADALNSSDVPGVSAVNGDGISREQLKRLWDSYVDLKKVNAPIIGLYELNPVYDTLSMASMRMLASFIYLTLGTNKKAHR